MRLHPVVHIPDFQLLAQTISKLNVQFETCGYAPILSASTENTKVDYHSRLFRPSFDPWPSLSYPCHESSHPVSSQVSPSVLWYVDMERTDAINRRRRLTILQIISDQINNPLHVAPQCDLEWSLSVDILHLEICATFQ